MCPSSSEMPSARTAILYRGCCGSAQSHSEQFCQILFGCVNSLLALRCLRGVSFSQGHSHSFHSDELMLTHSRMIESQASHQDGSQVAGPTGGLHARVARSHCRCARVRSK